MQPTVLKINPTFPSNEDKPGSRLKEENPREEESPKQDSLAYRFFWKLGGMAARPLINYLVGSYKEVDEKFLFELTGSNKCSETLKKLLTLYAPRDLFNLNKIYSSNQAVEVQAEFVIHFFAAISRLACQKEIQEKKIIPPEELFIKVVVFMKGEVEAAFKEADLAPEKNKFNIFYVRVQALFEGTFVSYLDMPIRFLANVLEDIYALSKTDFAPHPDPKISLSIPPFANWVVLLVKKEALDLTLPDDCLKPVILHILNTEEIKLEILLVKIFNRAFDQNLDKIFESFLANWNRTDDLKEFINVFLSTHFKNLLDGPFNLPTLRPNLQDLLVDNILLPLAINYKEKISAIVDAFNHPTLFLEKHNIQKEAAFFAHEAVKKFMPRIFPHLPEPFRSMDPDLIDIGGEKIVLFIFDQLGLTLFKENEYVTFDSFKQKGISWFHSELEKIRRGESPHRRADEIMRDLCPLALTLSDEFRGELEIVLKDLYILLQLKDDRAAFAKLAANFSEPIAAELVRTLNSSVDYFINKIFKNPIKIFKGFYLHKGDIPTSVIEVLKRELLIGISGSFASMEEALLEFLTIGSNYARSVSHLKNAFKERIKELKLDQGIEVYTEKDTQDKRVLALKKCPKWSRHLVRNWVDKLDNSAHIYKNWKPETFVQFEGLFTNYRVIQIDFTRTLFIKLLPQFNTFPKLIEEIISLVAEPLCFELEPYAIRIEYFSKGCENALRKDVPERHQKLISWILERDELKEVYKKLDLPIFVGENTWRLVVQRGLTYVIKHHYNNHAEEFATAIFNFLSPDLLNPENSLIEACGKIVNYSAPLALIVEPSLGKILSEKILKLRKCLLDTKVESHQNRLEKIVGRENGERTAKDTRLLARFLIRIIRNNPALVFEMIPEELENLFKSEGKFWEALENKLVDFGIQVLVNFLDRKPRFPKDKIVISSVTLLLKAFYEALPNRNRHLQPEDFLPAIEALWSQLKPEECIEFDLSKIKTKILPEFIHKNYFTFNLFVLEKEENRKRLKDILGSSALPVFEKVFGEIWFRDFIPFFLKKEKEKLSISLLKHVNIPEFDDKDKTLVSNVLEGISQNELYTPVFLYIGEFVESALLHYSVILFEGRDFKKMLNELFDLLLNGSEAYFKTLSSNVPSPSDQVHLGPLYNSSGITQLAHWKKHIDAFCKRLKINPEAPLCLPDSIKGKVLTFLVDDILPNALLALIESAISARSINNLLIQLLSNFRKNINENWNEQEERFREIRRLFNQLKKQNKYPVDDFIATVKKIKDYYGGDWVEMKAFFEELERRIKSYPDSLHQFIAVKHNEFFATWDKLNQNKALLNKLDSLRQAILKLVPTTLIGPLSELQGLRDMTAEQLGQLYTRWTENQSFATLLNLIIVKSLPVLVPGKVVEMGNEVYFEGSDVKIDHAHVRYATEKEDQHKIINESAEAMIDAIEHSIVRRIARFFMDMRDYLVDLLGNEEWLNTLFDFAREFLIDKIFIPLLKAILYLPLNLLEYIGMLIVMPDLKAIYKALHSDIAKYNLMNMFHHIFESLHEQKV